MILVTGANGFIGSHVVERLLRDGRKVRGLVRASSDLTCLEGVDVELARGDITDLASLNEPMRGVEIVVHVAGFVSDWDPRGECLSVNVHGTRNVIEAARAAGVRRRKRRLGRLPSRRRAKHACGTDPAGGRERREPRLV